MRALVVLSLFLLAGCASDFSCRQHAFAVNSTLNGGFPGSMIDKTVGYTPPPHPPLKQMLADCEKQ